MVGHCQIAACTRGENALSPSLIVENLHHISPSLRVNQQECAHEFFTCLFNALLRSHVIGVDPELNSNVMITTEQEQRAPVYQVFGGHVQTRVECLSCGYLGDALEAFSSLVLEIENSPSASLDGCFHHFIEVVHLDDANMYVCPQCKSPTGALLRKSLRKSPNTLVLLLKRFDSNRVSNKNAHVLFPLNLDFGVYKIDKPGDVNANYDLTGVVVRDGENLQCSHYY